MDGVDLLFPGQRDDAIDIQVRLYGPFAFSDQVRFIGFEAVEGQAIFLGVDGHGPQAQFVGGAQNADRDFAAIQGKQFFHG